MTSPLHVWIIDPTNSAIQPKLDPTPRYLNHGPKDKMRQQAKEHLARADYKLRSLSHTVDGNMIAYVYHKDIKPKTATKVAGWVFQRTSIPAIIK